MHGEQRERAEFDKDKDPGPSYDGANPESTRRPWIRAVKFWRNDTIVPQRKHGSKLYKALAIGSIGRHAADNLRDEEILSEKGFDLIMERIEKA